LIYRSLAISVFVLLVCRAASAQTQTCSSAEAKRALTEAGELRTWEVLHTSYHLYHNCDDGAIAEGYSESVARILVDRWRTLPRLAELTKSDPRFWKFVLKHIDSTLDTKDLKRMRSMAKTQCPSALHSVCTNLTREADAALKESVSSP